MRKFCDKGEKRDYFQIGDIRKNARNTRAVTVTLKAEAAEKLIGMGRLKAGVGKLCSFQTAECNKL